LVFIDNVDKDVVEVDGSALSEDLHPEEIHLQHKYGLDREIERRRSKRLAYLPPRGERIDRRRDGAVDPFEEEDRSLVGGGRRSDLRPVLSGRVCDRKQEEREDISTFEQHAKTANDNEEGRYRRCRSCRDCSPEDGETIKNQRLLLEQDGRSGTKTYADIVKDG
jgi:hypothetical protein